MVEIGPAAGKAASRHHAPFRNLACGTLEPADRRGGLRAPRISEGPASSSSRALPPLTDFSARQPNVQVSRTCLDRRYWSVEFDSDECEALSGLRHRA
jgi:hypothetical protein